MLVRNDVGLKGKAACISDAKRNKKIGTPVRM
jgi:hypothetical protein